MGIGVGVPLGVLLCLAAEMFWLRIRRCAQHTENATSAETETQRRYDKAESNTGGQGGDEAAAEQILEANGRPLSELMAEPNQMKDSPQRPAELQSNHTQ